VDWKSQVIYRGETLQPWGHCDMPLPFRNDEVHSGVSKPNVDLQVQVGLKFLWWKTNVPPKANLATSVVTP